MNRSEAFAFLKKTNIYEVNLRQYSREGNIQSFLKHIPRLRDMGVEILWLMPIHPIGIKNRKGTLGSYYSVKDFCDINPEFGTKKDFKELVETVHYHGMKIIIDWVANHAAWDNAWTTTNPDFFVRDGAGNFNSPYDWTDVIQIDHSNEAQQDAMIDAMKYWVKEFNIDGFRADLAHLTPLEFWKRARGKIEVIKPSLVWLAETEERSYHEAFDIFYAWTWMHASADFCSNNGDVNSLSSLLEKQRIDFSEQALHLYFTSNHDENSWNGTEFEKYGIYSKAMAVFTCTYPGAVPLIYSGQELPNYKRLKFFDKDEIEWTENFELSSFYKTLLQFHKRTFEGGDFKFLDQGKDILAFMRFQKEKEFLVFLNLGKENRNLNFSFIEGGIIYKDIFREETVFIAGNYNMELVPGGWLILEKQ